MQDPLAETGCDVVPVAPAVALVAWGRVRFADLPGYHRQARVLVDAALDEGAVPGRGRG